MLNQNWSDGDLYDMSKDNWVRYKANEFLRSMSKVVSHEKYLAEVAEGVAIAHIDSDSCHGLLDNFKLDSDNALCYAYIFCGYDTDIYKKEIEKIFDEYLIDIKISLAN